MKNTPFHIEENELDQLLRQFVLDGGSDKFTQNTLTMNADIIFSNAPGVAPDAAREMALIQKLEHAFIKRRGFGRFWQNGIIFLFLISAVVWIYKMNSRNTITASQNNGNNKNAFVPANSGDTCDALDNTGVHAVNFKTGIPSAKTDTFAADTFSQSLPPKKERYVTPGSRIPIERNWYEGNDALTTVDIPGPVFSAKATPDNYELTQNTFRITGSFPGLMFGGNPQSFSVAYYVGEPFKGFSDMLYFNYGEFTANQKTPENESIRWQIPWAIMEYANSDSLIVKRDSTRGNSFTHLFLATLPEKGIQTAMQSFYFRKYEVTNKEYREFINWVRASNGFANKKLMNEDYKAAFDYIFFNANSQTMPVNKNSIYVFPDTICWTTDFAFSFNEPMTTMYFWHAAYDNYPVVGISWYQAMAFLDWKTHMHQQQLDKENIPYEIEYTLPSDIEWDIVSNSEKSGKQMNYNFKAESTDGWMTDLCLSWPGHDDPYQRPNYLKNIFTKNEYYRGDFIRDGYFHTGPADLLHEKNKDGETGSRHLDKLGISWMDGNVSEWMLESYAENWKPFFQKHLAVLDADTSESSSIAKQIEMLYDKGNAKNGRLVRGANWYDERFSGRPGSERNEAGISPKRYVDPSEQHCTVGFRYVIHVKRK
ncbi:MAG: SUMF1/EgtB/PvdO family nonheme iron enzyme [Bacteroidota bacterium]|nr:SUMF1/EgtB/PvdO family nonheme iron enzyme [Bacteroidota bacterium]